MSSDQPRPEDMDPLTAPVWPITSSASPLDPQLAQIRDESSIHHRTIPAPPDVDQILSGEYTGWVPIIRAGESLQDAQQRADYTVNRIEQHIVDEDAPTQLVVTTTEGPRTTSEVLGAIGPQLRDNRASNPTSASSRIRDFIPDPDEVDSPADALELARQRIAQMRENLQKSLSNVTKSFDHPIFQPQSQPINNPPVSHTRLKPSVQQPSAAQEPVVEQTPQSPEVVQEPVTKFKVHEQTIESDLRVTPQFAVDETPAQDHSLELVIMRDEIKDLRARLDASQKLIEELMHRITNLAEMALKGRQN